MWCAQPLPCKHAGAQASGAHPQNLGFRICFVSKCIQSTMTPLLQFSDAINLQHMLFHCAAKLLGRNPCMSADRCCSAFYTYALSSTLYCTLLKSAHSGIGHWIRTESIAWFYMSKRFTSAIAVLLSLRLVYLSDCVFQNGQLWHNARTSRSETTDSRAFLLSPVASLDAQSVDPRPSCEACLCRAECI